MTSWDAEAHERLKHITASLREEGVLSLFERTVARVWKFNVDRFEPSEIGDTNLSLGMTAKENITTLILREAWTAGNPAGLGDRVHVTVSNGSLLVRAGGVRVRVMKSAATPILTEPGWDSGFSWQSDSDIRREAAASNMKGYNPFVIGPGGLFDDMYPPNGSVDQLRETILVWAGGSTSPYTGGWLGFPTLGERPWLAVEKLWWHEAGSALRDTRPGDLDAFEGDTFADRQPPKPEITLKPRPKTAEQ
jgi:hypothetical protein